MTQDARTTLSDDEVAQLRGMLAMLGPKKTCRKLGLGPEDLEDVAVHGAHPGDVDEVRRKLQAMR